MALGLAPEGLRVWRQLEPVARAEVVATDNRIEYRRGDLVEWYVNDRRGLEQGFTLSQRPGGPKGDAPCSSG